MLIFVLLAVFFFSFGMVDISVGGRVAAIPLPTTDSFSTVLLTEILHDTVPEGVALIVTGPLTAFVAQVKVALLLAFAGALPFILFQLISYLRPALYGREARFLALSIVPAVVLFFTGALFSYFFIVPKTFAVLYGFAENLGATTFISVGEFVGLAAALILMSGLAFMVPVVMVLLTAVRIVPARMWAANWRFATIGFLILSAIITPDGSGISMVLLALPVSALYGAGAVVSTQIEKQTTSKKPVGMH